MYFSEVKYHLIENNIKGLIKSYSHSNYFKYHFFPFCFPLYVLDLKHLKRYRRQLPLLSKEAGCVVSRN